MIIGRGASYARGSNDEKLELDGWEPWGIRTRTEKELERVDRIAALSDQARAAGSQDATDRERSQWSRREIWRWLMLGVEGDGEASTLRLQRGL